MGSSTFMKGELSGERILDRQHVEFFVWPNHPSSGTVVVLRDHVICVQPEIRKTKMIECTE